LNQSTRSCISILNAFSFVLATLGLIGIGIVVMNATKSTTDEMIMDISALLGAVVVAVLLRSTAQVLRLLTEISENLRRTPSAESAWSSRAA